ncbi:FHA domain-containing protein [Cyanobacteria bacterium FACHB-63]|nr:FHA domain-containing protein [Cyanobacteria bacterium FACHB-63]
MTIRNNRLFACIQELKQLIADDLGEDQFFRQIDQDLDKITSELESEKLTVHLLSTDPNLVNSLHHLLNFEQDLEKNYQVQLHQLPKLSPPEQKPVSSAFLVLQELAEDTEEIRQTRYKLFAEEVVIVGRKPGCTISIPDQYTHVSGQHLEVHYFPATDRNSSPEWRVKNCDGCKNGTYLNGEQLVESCILKSGNRLVLGDELLSSKSPQLIFEDQSMSDNAIIEPDGNQRLKKLVNCDILFLIVDSHCEPLKEGVLQLASTSLVNKFFLVILSHELIEIFQVTQETHTSISIENLKHYMAATGEKQNYPIKVQRIIFQIISTIDRITQFLVSKQERINQKIEEAEQSQKRRKPLQEDTALLLKMINEQKASLLKAIETSLACSKQDLLDDSLSNSILQKIQELVDELEVQIVKQGRKKYLELRAKDFEANVNDYLVQACKNELLDWANEEWRKICQEYGNGGLESLVRSSNTTLKSTCKRNNSTFTVKVEPITEFEEVFQAPIRKILVRIEYREDPIWLYFIKKIRSSVFQVMGILFLLSFLGLSRTSFIKSVNKQISSSVFLSILIGGVSIWLICKLYRSYQRDKELEICKLSDKVRQDLKNHYYKVVKNRLVEKLSQELGSCLKHEVNKFDAAIKLFLNTVTSAGIPEVRNNQVDSRNHLKNYQDQTKKLRDFQRVKDKLQRLQSSG